MAGGGGDNRYKNAEYHSCVYDLWALDVYANLIAEVQNVEFGPRIYEETWDFYGTQSTGANVQSALVIGETANTTIKMSTGGIVARQVLPNNEHTENEYELLYRSETQRDVIDDEIIINVAVHGVAAEGSKSRFRVIFMVSAESAWINPVSATFVGSVCMAANIGVRKTVSWAEHVSTSIVGDQRWISWWVNFDDEWPDYVHMSDTFDVELTLYEDVTNAQTATYSASCNQEIIVQNNIDNEITPTAVDFGNGYSARTALTELTESDGVSKPLPQLLYDGEVIYQYDTNRHATESAYQAENASMAIVANGIGLLASGGTVQSVDLPESLTGIVTKRFGGD